MTSVFMWGLAVFNNINIEIVASIALREGFPVIAVASVA